MTLLTVNNFFLCVFKNTDQKDICAESKPKHEEKFFWGGFLQNKKYYYLGPLEFFENENMTPERRCARPDILELDFLNHT